MIHCQDLLGNSLHCIEPAVVEYEPVAAKICLLFMSAVLFVLYFYLFQNYLSICPMLIFTSMVFSTQCRLKTHHLHRHRENLRNMQFSLSEGVEKKDEVKKRG